MQATTETRKTETTGAKAPPILDKRVSVYVPTVQSSGEPLPEDQARKLVEVTARTLADLFGGSTAVNGTGYYENQREDVTLVFANTKEVNEDQFAGVIGLGLALKVIANQESVAVEFGNTIILL